jgi:hypothetical protein
VGNVHFAAGGETYGIGRGCFTRQRRALFSGGELWACVAWGSGCGRGGLSIGRGRRVERSAGRRRRQIRSRRSARRTRSRRSSSTSLTFARTQVSASKTPRTLCPARRIGGVRFGGGRFRRPFPGKSRPPCRRGRRPRARCMGAAPISGVIIKIHFALCPVSREL